MLHAPGDRPPPEPPDGARGRDRSGRAFVLGAGLVALALVGVFAVVGPALQRATTERAPDPPPVVVAEAEFDGQRWEAVATEPSEELPCLAVTLGGQEAAEVCGDQRGPSSLRQLGAVEAEGSTLVLAVVDARTATVDVAAADEGARLAVAYADYGFPMGFAAGVVEAEVKALEQVVARDEDGEARGTADCARGLDDHDPAADELPPFALGRDTPLGGGDGCLLLD